MFDLSAIFYKIPFGFLLATLLFLVYWVNGFFIIYHLVRFGIGVRPKVLALVFFLGSMMLFMAAVGLSLTLDLSVVGKFLRGDIVNTKPYEL